jgi:hypothetical protein
VVRGTWGTSLSFAYHKAAELALVSGSKLSTLERLSENMKQLNFGRNITQNPRSMYAPRSEEEVIEILNANRGSRFRCIGRLHSWSNAVQCDDLLLDLRYLNNVHQSANGDSTVARAGGGCQIKHLLAHGGRTAWPRDVQAVTKLRPLGASDHGNAAAWPLVCKQQRHPRKVFRSSIAWLSDWLFTLRRMSYFSTTQDSLPMAGQALADEISNHQVPLQGFKVVENISLAFPKLAWGNCIDRTLEAIGLPAFGEKHRRAQGKSLEAGGGANLLRVAKQRQAEAWDASPMYPYLPETESRSDGMTGRSACRRCRDSR